MEFCYPQDFLDEIHSARKNRQITASFLHKEIVKSRRRRGKKNSSNQGVLFDKKISSNQPCPISDKCWFSERVEEDLNLKMIKVNVNFLPLNIRTHRLYV